MQTDLTGKTALITGASRGIGAATAHVLADCGANVALMARTTAEIDAVSGEIRANGGRAIAVAGDVAAYNDVVTAVSATVSAFGGLDILINNAGLIEPISRLDESEPDAWGTVIDVNVKGVYHGMRCAIPAMRAAGGGVIVNISSGAAQRPLEGWSHYCASKAAVLMLTQSAHLEYADDGIRTVGLSPGTVATHMQVAIKASGINPVSQLDPSDHIDPVWVGRAVAVLCGPDGAPYAGTDFSLREKRARQLVGLSG